MIVLTSFKDSEWITKKLNIDKENIYSVARWQPKGYSYKKLTFLSATDKEGNKLLLRNFENPIQDYADALKEGYKARWKEIKKWLNNLDNNEDIILACWCPHSKQTEKQIEKFGTFCCHTGLIGKMINKHRPDITVVLDRDRDKNLVPEWKPDTYLPLDELLHRQAFWEKSEKISNTMFLFDL